MIAAKRYAEGLIELAKETNKLDIFMNDMNLISIVCKDKQFLNAYISPNIKKEEKKNIIDRLFKNKIDRYSLNLLYILIDKKREILLPFIPYYYKILYDKINGFVDVVISTPIDLNNTILEKISKWLKKNYNIEKPRFEIKIDKKLIGGIKLYFNNIEVDASIFGTLENIKKQLIQKVI
ncbi:ATP synthase F1 subunit delta [Caldicellulosiruptoraceae bacterium PP1]